MDITTFGTLFPEFAATITSNQALVQGMLDQAALELDQNVCGDYYDSLHGYTAAHKLALSPFGQQAKLMSKDGTTTYEKHMTRLRRMVAAGGRVA